MKRFFLVFAFVLFVTSALWFTVVRFQNKRSNSPLFRVTGRNGTSEAPVPTATPVRDAQDDSKRSNRDDVVKVRQVIEARNVPINLWGKVVDQDGLPLSEVRIVYTYSIYHGNDQGVAWVEPETGKGETISDANGLFAITNLRGHDLTVESLTKTGYIHRERWQLAYNFYGDIPGNKFEPHRDKPVQVTLIQMAATESLVHVKGEMQVRGDGTPERWNLWSGEADPNGEFMVIFRADPGVSANPTQVANWSADLEMVKGGIVEAPWDQEVRRAPDSGYSAVVAYPKTEQMVGVPHRSFYVQTADKKYGRVQVELVTNLDGRTADCYITADMNPRPGSRNLEPSEEE